MLRNVGIEESYKKVMGSLEEVMTDMGLQTRFKFILSEQVYLGSPSWQSLLQLV
jgi:hypothetical protein